MTAAEELQALLGQARIQCGSVAYWIEQGETREQALAAMRVLIRQIEAANRALASKHDFSK